MDILSMTPEQATAEARRREERKAKGLPLTETPVEKAALVREQDSRLEKEIQAECRKRYIAFGCVVFSTSQSRPSKVSAGIPDLYVFHRRAGVDWWHEVKTPDGEQSSAQKFFQDCATVCRRGYVLGGIAAAEAQLIKIGVAERQPDGSLDFQR